MVPGPNPLRTETVYYEGSDKIYYGYNLCANSDYGTAATSEPSRGVRAEKPSASNLKRYLGVVAPGRPGGYQGPCEVPIYRATVNAPLVGIYTDLTAATIGTTVLTLQAGSYYAGGAGEGPVIAQAAQTITAAGVVLANLRGLSDSLGEIVTASSRTTVQLPTAAIWNNFDLAGLRANPFMGSLLDTDFRHGDGFPAHTFIDATYAASAAGKTITEDIYPGTTAIGELHFMTTNDNQAAEAQWDCPIVASGGARWAFECRVKAENITTEKASFQFGLASAQSLVGNLQADGGAVPTTSTSYLTFNSDAGATAALDLDYLLSGETHVEHKAAYATMVANTYFTVGLYYNGTTIATYLNGVSVAASSVAAADIADGNFPAATILVPTIGLKGAHTDEFLLSFDWMRCAQAHA